MAESSCQQVVRMDPHDGDCARCPAHGTCDREEPEMLSPEEGEGTLRGWSFAGAAAGYFLIPLILACAGAMAADSPLGQCVGAAAGCGLGMVGAAAVASRRRGSEEEAWLPG